MGRYYSGDIEGKFWFAVQNSDDAIHFGGSHDYIDSEGEVVEDGDENEAVEMYFHFSTEDLPDIEEGILGCKRELGSYYEKMEQFFEENHAYNDEMLSKYLETNVLKTRHLLENYARIILGLKIEECVKTHGECNFEAEL
jgi:hypothetical protein